LIRLPPGGELLLTDRLSDRDIRLQPNISGIERASFSPDGRFVAVASWLGSARVWETATGRERGTFRGFLMGVHSTAFSPDATRLATTSTGTEAVRLWDMESFQELLTLPARNTTFTSTQFSPDGNVLGAMNYGLDLHLWRAPSWADIEATESSPGLN
jgi:WD40 repeat protein